MPKYTDYSEDFQVRIERVAKAKGITPQMQFALYMRKIIRKRNNLGPNSGTQLDRCN